MQTVLHSYCRTDGGLEDEHWSALRGTPRFGFAMVPNALGLELDLLALLEVALVPASWRDVLHCSRRNAPSPLRLACCTRGRVVLYRCRGRPPSPPSPLRSASPLRLAFLRT
jgi:hypothetical protein